MSLENYTDIALQAELEKRNKLKMAGDRPKLIANPDISELERTCVRYMDYLEKDGWADDDFNHYIYEAALISLFGKDVFKWINKVRR